jgi:hypothetical protein
VANGRPLLLPAAGIAIAARSFGREFGIWMEGHIHWRNPDAANSEWAGKFDIY